MYNKKNVFSIEEMVTVTSEIGDMRAKGPVGKEGHQ